MFEQSPIFLENTKKRQQSQGNCEIRRLKNSGEESKRTLLNTAKKQSHVLTSFSLMVKGSSKWVLQGIEN